MMAMMPLLTVEMTRLIFTMGLLTTIVTIMAKLTMTTMMMTMMMLLVMVLTMVRMIVDNDKSAKRKTKHKHACI